MTSFIIHIPHDLSTNTFGVLSLNLAMSSMLPSFCSFFFPPPIEIMIIIETKLEYLLLGLLSLHGGFNKTMVH